MYLLSFWVARTAKASDKAFEVSDAVYIKDLPPVARANVVSLFSALTDIATV